MISAPVIDIALVVALLIIGFGLGLGVAFTASFFMFRTVMSNNFVVRWLRGDFK